MGMLLEFSIVYTWITISVLQLRAYANIQPKGFILEKKLLYLDVNFKAYVLCESAVKPYSRGQIPEFCDEHTGMRILQFIYIVGFVAVLLFVPVLVILLSNNINLILEDEWSRSSSIIAGGTTVSSTFVGLSMFAELSQMGWLVSANNNWFAQAKFAFMLIIFIWSVSFTSVLIFIWKSKCNNISNKLILFMYISVASIATFASHLGLIVFPTVIYLFIHPLNTMSLIFLHISIMYCMTVLVGIFIYHIHQWSIWMRNVKKYKYCCEFLTWFICLFYLCCMFSGVVLGYITIIEFYQLVINRNLYDQLSWTSIMNNIPALVMVFFTWILNKEFFKKE